MGLGDRLIYPENIAHQYYAMYKHSPQLAHLKAYVFLAILPSRVSV